ncbi:E3 ubiquitin-protein ligase, putative [Plasmodium knowlesi strain H]|uniref:E3 ubiquitin-protein ligase CHIP n=3 Tax=Plasmodium knowlesi TaxID=5850 RepID=A0A5K1V8Q8_PLAKH|nr:E3 ubiquitin-protein ligase, putative [Plasmodium knowlesi strain H]OTN68675.1 putative E3 ubiquitin-protein ligase [Plasmodium knowlesi]CAA9986142.1 E3 ubiquitin-protein ligase, putative [Plasmodium knowlesi strain H]SBO25323.1 E3 ubiquitin-protein ligase, putative [Plasmodium knowlesi strain H]SBO27637.1 E3 ubiquitin-protein ligase, putative [Plasmodium knowlesi strain H]VVS75616.1 E3 ubiquitin-protein ligase, putative [Plasmodium knowlesi strain H]|eukprot:XP_002257554.1 erythrocyte membrane protein, putative [Plasmodium knowlesi strain H]
MKSIAEIKGCQSEHFKNKYNSTKKNKKRVGDFRNFCNYRRVKKKVNRKSDRGNQHWDAKAIKNRAIFLHTKFSKSLNKMETNKGEEKKNFLKNWNMNYLSNNFSAFMKGAESVAGDRGHNDKSSLNARSAHSGNRCFLNQKVDPQRGGDAHNDGVSHREGSNEMYSQGNRPKVYAPQQNGPNLPHTTCKQVQGNSPNVNNSHPYEYVQSSTKENNHYGDIRGVWEKIKSRSGLSNFVESVIQDGVNAVSETIGAFSDGGYVKDPNRNDSRGNHIGSIHYNRVEYDPPYGDQSDEKETYHIASSNNRTTGNSSSQNNGNGNSQHSGKGGNNTQNNYYSTSTGGGTNSNNYNSSGNSGYNNSASGYVNRRTPNGGGGNDNNDDGDGDDDGNNGHYGGNGRCDNNGDSNDEDDDNEDDNADGDSDIHGERSNDRSGHQNERVHDPGDPNGKMYYSINNGSSASGASSYINADSQASNNGAMKHQYQKKRKSGRTNCPATNDNNNEQSNHSASSANFIGGGIRSNGYGDYNNGGVEYGDVERRTSLNLRRGINDGNIEYYNSYPTEGSYDRSATEAPSHSRGNYDCSGGHYGENYGESVPGGKYISSRGDDTHGGSAVGRSNGADSESTYNHESNLDPTNNSTMSKNIGNKRNYATNVNYKDMGLNPSYCKQGDGNSKQIRKGRDSGDSGDSNHSNHSGDCGGCGDNVDRGDGNDAEDQSQKRHVHATNSDMLNLEDRKREAEKYKVLGNQSYKLGYFESAIDYYTKAISYDNTNHVYYTNRALCYKKQKLWKLANSDARQALNLEEESVKAHFILGLTLLHLNSLEEGLKKLTKAKTLSSYLKDSNESEINRYILQAKKLIYLRDEQNKQLTYTELQSFLIDKISLLNQIGYISNEEKSLRTQQTENLFKEILNSFQKKQIPDYLCCKISMCLMNEPVITPSGMTYDKIFLYEHVKHNGSFDPVSREQFSMREVIPNYAIKEATDNFLKCNPWAFEE